MDDLGVVFLAPTPLTSAGAGGAAEVKIVFRLKSVK